MHSSRLLVPLTPDRALAKVRFRWSGWSLFCGCPRASLDVPAKLSARMRVYATGQGRKTDDTDAHSIALVGSA